MARRSSPGRNEDNLTRSLPDSERLHSLLLEELSPKVRVEEGVLHMNWTANSSAASYCRDVQRFSLIVRLTPEGQILLAMLLRLELVDEIANLSAEI